MIFKQWNLKYIFLVIANVSLLIIFLIICFFVFGKKIKNYYENHYNNNYIRDTMLSARDEYDIQLLNKKLGAS